jgi:membrane protein EpsK
LPKNLAANIAYFLVSVIVGIFLVPYFISTLGVAAYGIIPLATSITGYVTIIIQSLNAAVSRFLTINLQREDYPSANQTFNTALFGLSTVIVLMIPIVVIVAIVIPQIFNIPAGQSNSTSLLFLGVCAAALLQAWSGTFTVQLFAYNRLDLQNFINLLGLIFQVVTIVVLFTIFGPTLEFIGLAYLIAAFATSIVAIILARRVCPYLVVSIQSFDRSQLKSLSEMGGWVVVNQIGSLLFLQIDIIVVNILFGATSSGEYAVALQFGLLLRTIGAVFSGVLTPIIFTYYAKKQTDDLIHVTTSGVKLMGLVMALPIGLLCGLAPQILTIWVGEAFVGLAPLVVLLTAHLVVNLAVLPIFSINVAYNRVRVPGIITFFMGIGNFALAFALPLITGWGYYGVAAAGAIVLTLKNAIFTPWYATRILGVPVHTFTSAILPGIIATILIAVCAAIIPQFFPLAGLSLLIITGGVFTVIYLIITWQIGLDKFERDLFSSYLPTKIRWVFQ